jgi:hypothetical protein
MIGMTDMIKRKNNMTEEKNKYYKISQDLDDKYGITKSPDLPNR